MANHKFFKLPYRQNHYSCVMASYAFALEFFIRQKNEGIELDESFVYDFFRFYCLQMINYWHSSPALMSTIEQLSNEGRWKDIYTYYFNPSLVNNLSKDDLETLAFNILHYQCQELDKKVAQKESSGYDNVKFIHEQLDANTTIGNVSFPNNFEIIDLCCGAECAPEKTKLNFYIFREQN